MDAFTEAFERQVRPAFIRRLARRSATALSTGRVVQELNFGAEECRYNYTTLPRPRMSSLYLGENSTNAPVIMIVVKREAAAIEEISSSSNG